MSSSVFATTLLALLGTWSVFASAIPQGAETGRDVSKWAQGHPGLESFAHALGLHHAFSNPVFVGAVLLLGLSTALCAWQRTKAAVRKSRTFREDAKAEERPLIENHDLELRCDPALSRQDVLSIASETLHEIGVKTKRRGDVLYAVPSVWSAWGSPVFHWALLALVLIVFGGNLLRLQGQMGVAVGQTKADRAASYGILHVGPLQDFRRVERAFRVDAFEPHYKSGGVDRGPTPTVTLLEGGRAVKTQRVYPNHTLKSGGLTIYPTGFGLALAVSVLGNEGQVAGRGVQLVDFVDDQSGRTMPVGSIMIPDASGRQVYGAVFTVPLEKQGNGYGRELPKEPSAQVLVTDADGRKVLERTVRPGETIQLQGADSLRLDAVTYYARLQIVDDWSIALLYGGLVVALAGLSVATLTRQQIVLMTAVDDAEGVRLIAKVRLIRNASTSRDEIRSELTRALGSERRSMTA